jgi:transposase InsO family protein
MDLARYVVEAVVREGRSYREVAAAHGVSKSWVAKMVARFREGGYEALEPRSKAAHHVPHRIPAGVEDAIVRWRKQLTEDGFDAGAATIHYHLGLELDVVPSVSTIWRVLKRGGFVTPQPHKRPKSSWIRFEAQLPNECWQADVTHWQLADGSEVEICNMIDDYSRVAVGSRAFRITTARAVVAVFTKATEKWGLPASVLTDNGLVFTARHRGGANTFETTLLALGIEAKHSRPYHPQTCGKVERFHQTLKRYLAKQPPAATIRELQAQIDRFIDYYNNIRPHRAKNRTTPRVAFDTRDKARPTNPPLDTHHVRVRQDKIDENGTITLRHNGRLHHIGIGRDHHRKQVLILIAGLDIRIITPNGESLRHLTLNPNRDYQPTGRPPGPPKGRTPKTKARAPSTMP